MTGELKWNLFTATAVTDNITRTDLFPLPLPAPHPQHTHTANHFIGGGGGSGGGVGSVCKLEVFTTDCTDFHHNHTVHRINQCQHSPTPSSPPHIHLCLTHISVSHTHTQPCTCTCALSLSRSLSLSHTHTHSLSHTHTLSLIHTHTHTLTDLSILCGQHEVVPTIQTSHRHHVVHKVGQGPVHIQLSNKSTCSSRGPQHALDSRSAFNATAKD